MLLQCFNYNLTKMRKSGQRIVEEEETGGGGSGGCDFCESGQRPSERAVLQQALRGGASEAPSQKNAEAVTATYRLRGADKKELNDCFNYLAFAP